MAMSQVGSDVLAKYAGKVLALGLGANQILAEADNLDELEAKMRDKPGISREQWYPWGVPDWPKLRDDLVAIN